MFKWTMILNIENKPFSLIKILHKDQANAVAFE